MKRTLLLALLLSVTASAFALEAEINGLWYDLVGNEASVIQYKNGVTYSGNIVIPETVKYNGNSYSVTSIMDGSYDYDGAFYHCSGLTSVTIPNSVTSIGGNAFYGCSGLTSVTIGNSVTSIGSFAFYDCNSLTSVTIGNSVTSIGGFAFYGCNSLTSVTIPNSVTSIGGQAFMYCSGLTSVTIPNSVTSIGSYAFYGCSGLTSVTIPNSVTGIGQGTFYNCSGLTSVSIPDGVTSIGYNAFDGCNGITLVKVAVTDYAAFCENKVVSLIYSNIGKTVQLINKEGDEIKDYVVPEGVTSIGSSAFRNCTGLSSVTIPNSVTSIGGESFYNCSGLTSVTIGNSVTSIGNSAFYNCSGLTSVHISDIAAWCNIAFSGSDSNPLYHAHHLYLGDEEITDLVIPDSVTSIGNFAFEFCSGLTSVTIPSSVTSIKNYTFYNCSGLTSVTIPTSVTSIGYAAFSGCSGLTSVTIPNSVTSIGTNAFSGCSSIMSVKSYINEPFNVTGLFAEDTYREGTLYVPAGTKDLYIRFDGWREFLNIVEMEKESAPNGQCAKPSIIIAGKGMRFECETPGAEFESILTTEEQRFTGNKLVMENKDLVYILTVYATAPGYDRSEPAQVKFIISRNDVNQDGSVDVADIATIIDAMAAQAREQADVEE